MEHSTESVRRWAQSEFERFLGGFLPQIRSMLPGQSCEAVELSIWDCSEPILQISFPSTAGRSETLTLTNGAAPTEVATVTTSTRGTSSSTTNGGDSCHTQVPHLILTARS